MKKCLSIFICLDNATYDFCYKTRCTLCNEFAFSLQKGTSKSLKNCWVKKVCQSFATGRSISSIKEQKYVLKTRVCKYCVL